MTEYPETPDNVADDMDLFNVDRFGEAGEAEPTGHAEIRELNDLIKPHIFVDDGDNYYMSGLGMIRMFRIYKPKYHKYPTPDFTIIIIHSDGIYLDDEFILVRSQWNASKTGRSLNPRYDPGWEDIKFPLNDNIPSIAPKVIAAVKSLLKKADEDWAYRG